ncbi:MAG: hypothetical protein JJD98_00180 [Polaromonas sp.]|nr:hypothetical protein [Polaromonas sp.]
MVEVEILGCVMTTQYGTLKAGDILRTNAEFAAHLVKDCAAAKYTQAKRAAVAIDDPVKPTKRK